MSERNGDRSRFHVNRKRKLRHRERVRALRIALSEREGASAGQPRADATVTKRR